MIMYILIAVAAALFAGGVWFLMKGVQGNKEDLNVVPISDLKEIKDLQKKENISSPSFPNANLSKHVVDENTKRAPSGGSDASAFTKGLQQSIEQLRAENLRLTNALKSEVSSKDTSTLSTIERDKLKQKDENLRLANERLEKLTDDYNKLRKQMDDKNAAADQLQARLNDKMSEYAQLTEKQADNSKDFYGEIEAQKEKNRQLDQKVQELTLKLEQQVKLESMAGEQKNLVVALEKQISDMKNNNNAWQLKLDEEIGKWRKENESLMRCLKEEEGKSKELSAALKALTKRHEESSHVYANSSDQQASLLGNQIAKISSERDEYKMKMRAWEDELEKLREMNKHLIEKEKILQYELTKSRAQTLGLERICEDFKLMLQNSKQFST